jgi:GTP-binding protein Era
MSFKAGFVGLIGLPNAGKSTLLNLLVEEKVSIVTPKPQTTRRRVVGILSLPEAQVILVDAPGVVKAKSGLNAFLEREALDVIGSSDVLCAVLNLDEDKKENLDQILEMVRGSGKPWFAVITKVDLIDKRHRLTKLKEELREKSPNVTILEVSKNWGEDTKDFRDAFVREAAKLLPTSLAPLYDVELFTPHTVRELAAEVIREKCFEELHQEIPYNLAVRINKFDESAQNLVRIFAEIVVSKENHKGIVIGKGGAMIKGIGTKARAELEKMLDQKVFLQLDVSVREEWFENPRLMKELGYVVDEK